MTSINHNRPMRYEEGRAGLERGQHKFYGVPPTSLHTFSEQ